MKIFFIEDFFQTKPCIEYVMQQLAGLLFSWADYPEVSELFVPRISPEAFEGAGCLSSAESTTVLARGFQGNHRVR